MDFEIRREDGEKMGENKMLSQNIADTGDIAF